MYVCTFLSLNNLPLALGTSIVSAERLMKVGGCYNVSGLPEYSFSDWVSGGQRRALEEQLLWANIIPAKHFPLASYSSLQNTDDG